MRAIIGNAEYPLEVRNLAAALFQLEKARDEPTLAGGLCALGRGARQSGTGQPQAGLRALDLQEFHPAQASGDSLADIDDFHEVHVMLQQRVEQWNAEIREQGRHEGRLEGRQENQRSTALAMLQRTNLTKRLLPT
ncbi:MAG: hypothetical protein MZV65_40935 [Chromatiales bacterium]|nr:hypothetical protein [Chromatiales bacterium]